MKPQTVVKNERGFQHRAKTVRRENHATSAYSSSILLTDISSKRALKINSKTFIL
jgi:hypothetical protein